MNSTLNQLKFNAVVDRLSERVADTMAVAELPSLFPGTTLDWWRDCQSRGELPSLPSTKKVAVVDAIDFFVTCSVNRCIPKKEPRQARREKLQLIRNGFHKQAQ